MNTEQEKISAELASTRRLVTNADAVIKVTNYEIPAKVQEKIDLALRLGKLAVGQ